MKKIVLSDCAVILMSLNYWVCGYRLAGLALIMTYGVFRFIKNKAKQVEILFCTMLQLTCFCLVSLFLKDFLLVSTLLIYIFFICLILSCNAVELYNQKTALSYYKGLKKLILFSTLITMVLLFVPNEIWVFLGYPLLKELSRVQIILYAFVYQAPFFSIGILFCLKKEIQPLQSIQIVSIFFKNVLK